MNRIVIKLNETGELDGVICDVETRVFILDENCANEPLYELTEGAGKITGVQYMRKAMGDNLAATSDSDGPWLKTSAVESLK